MDKTEIPTINYSVHFKASLNLMEPGPLLLFSLFISILSNIFSNVPLTVLVLAQLTPCGKQKLLVLYLAWLTTVSGNLTMFGSVANLIVAQQAEVVCSRWKAQGQKNTRKLGKNAFKCKSQKEKKIELIDENVFQSGKLMEEKDLNFSKEREALSNFHLTFWKHLTLGPISTMLVLPIGIIVIRIISFISELIHSSK